MGKIKPKDLSFSILSFCRVTGVSSKLLDLKKAQIMLSKGPAFSQVEQGKFWILQVLLCLLKLQEKANCKLMSNSEIWSAIIVFYFFFTYPLHLPFITSRKKVALNDNMYLLRNRKPVCHRQLTKFYYVESPQEFLHS